MCERLDAWSQAGNGDDLRRAAAPGQAAERASYGSPHAAKRNKAGMRIGSEESSHEISSATAVPTAATASATPATVPLFQTAAASSASMQPLEPGSAPLQRQYQVTAEQQQAATAEKKRIVDLQIFRHKKE